MAKRKPKTEEELQAEKARQFHASPAALKESADSKEKIIESNLAAIDKAVESKNNKVTLNFVNLKVEFDLVIIPVEQHDDIEIHPSNARLQRHVNEISTRELTFEIQEQGQIYPIICIKIGSKILVVDGSQRTFTLKLLKLPIMAFIVDLDAMPKEKADEIFQSIERNSLEFSKSSNTFKNESLYEKGLKYLDYINSETPPKTTQAASKRFQTSKSVISIASRLAMISSDIIDSLPDPSGLGKKLAKDLIDLVDSHNEEITNLCLTNDSLISITASARENWRYYSKQANANEIYLKSLSDLCNFSKAGIKTDPGAKFKEIRELGTKGRVTFNKRNQSFKLEIKQINESCYKDIKEVMGKYGLEMESFN